MRQSKIAEYVHGTENFEEIIINPFAYVTPERLKSSGITRSETHRVLARERAKSLHDTAA